MPPRASIVVPLYQRADLTAGCLAALDRTGTLERAEVLLVDNASTDGTPALCREWSDRVRVLRNEENRGFAIGCNQGARAATGEVVVFLNNDTEVHDGWLEPLLEAVCDPEVGVAGSRLLYPGGRVQHAGMAMMPGCVPVHLHRYLPGDHPVVNRSRDLAIVTGACLAIRRELFLEMGAFDEGYRNGFEDTDLCLRLAARGLRARYRGDSVVTHLESMSPGRLDDDHLNGARFRRRWRHWRPDLARLLAEDGLEGLGAPDVIWRGPLFDDSAAARAGREAVAALEERGHRPAVIELPLGPAAAGVGPATPPALLAAVNRLYLSRGVARVFHHVAGPGAPAPVAGAQLVAVAAPGADLAGVRADAVLTGADAEDPAGAADRLLGPVPARPEGIGYWGPALAASREADACRALAWALTEDGRPVRLVATDGAAPGRAGGLPDLGPQDFLPGLWVAGGPPDGGGDPAGAWSQPVLAAGGRLAGWCWADAEGVPAAWWEGLRVADEVWVPSEWNARAMTAAGLDPDLVRVVPPPIDVGLFAPPAARRPADAPVTFLAVLDWTRLGGWDVALRAFVETFAADEPVRLRLVLRRPARSPEADVLSLLAELGRDAATIPDVELVPEPPAEAALAAALREADALVHPVRGEGLGRELLAAMACGVPVLATATGAQSELLAGAHLPVVGVERVRPVMPGDVPPGSPCLGLACAEPSLPGLRRALRAVADEPERWRERALPLVERVHAYAAAPVVAARVRDRLDHLLARGRARAGA